MSNESNLVSHEGRYSLVSLPDGWTGKISGKSRVISSFGNAEEYYIGKKIDISESASKRVLCFTTDNYMNIGIRSCLERMNNIRVRIVNKVQDAKLTVIKDTYDIAILTVSTNTDSGAILRMIMMLRKRNNQTYIMIVSEHDGHFFEKISKIWKGIWWIDSRESLSYFNASIEKLFMERNQLRNEFWDVLTNRQYETLKLLSFGHKISEVSKMMNVSIKTISQHKQQAFYKVGAHKKNQQAWILRAIRD